MARAGLSDIGKVKVSKAGGTLVGWTLPKHPKKALIRELWPDKHLYASILLLIGAGLAAAFTIVVYVIPIRYAQKMPTFVEGALTSGELPWGLVFPTVSIVLALISFYKRIPALGFVAAGIEFVTFGALGVSSLLALAAIVFLVRARREGEHRNPQTAALHAMHWPDKALAAALLLAIGGLAALVWGAIILTGWLDVRQFDGVAWGVLSLVGAALAFAGAATGYWQRSLALAFVGSVALAATMSFVVIGPALAIGAFTLLLRARREGEFVARTG